MERKRIPTTDNTIGLEFLPRREIPKRPRRCETTTVSGTSLEGMISLPTPVLALSIALAHAFVAALGASCNAHRAGDFGVLCPTPIVAHTPKNCRVSAAQRKTIAGYYDRTSLHHRAQLHYAFPHDAGGDGMLAIFLDKPVSGTPNSYEVLNPPDSQTDGLVYERCGNLVHSGAPYGI